MEDNWLLLFAKKKNKFLTNQFLNLDLGIEHKNSLNTNLITYDNCIALFPTKP